MQTRTTEPPLADPNAREFLRRADPVLTDDEMLQLAQRWRPYRSLAVSYPFASEFA